MSHDMSFQRTIVSHFFTKSDTFGFDVVPEVQFRIIVSVSSISSITRSSHPLLPFCRLIRCPRRTISSYSPDFPSTSSSTIIRLHLYPLTNCSYSLSTSTTSGFANSKIQHISTIISPYLNEIYLSMSIYN